MSAFNFGCLSFGCGQFVIIYRLANGFLREFPCCCSEENCQKPVLDRAPSPATTASRSPWTPWAACPPRTRAPPPGQLANHVTRATVLPFPESGRRRQHKTTVGNCASFPQHAPSQWPIWTPRFVPSVTYQYFKTIFELYCFPSIVFFCISKADSNDVPPNIEMYKENSYGTVIVIVIVIINGHR